MGEWRQLRLGDLGEVNRGRSRHRPRDAKHLYGGPFPFIQTGDIKQSNGRITGHTQTYSDAGLAQSRLWPKDTMVITIAANIAETAILTYPACFPDSVVGFIADPAKCDVRFIEYLFRLLRRQIQHENVGTGSVQDNINLQTLDRLILHVPDVAEQCEIASILSTFDDKLDLNRRMNETLEAMARAIFKDWFVDFGPTRAKMEGRAPYLAPEIWSLFPDRLDNDDTPQGWYVGNLGTYVLNFDSKRVPVSGAERAKRQGPYPYHGATGVMDHVDNYLFDGIYLLVGEDGSVVKEETGTAFTQYVSGKIWVNNHAHVLQGKEPVSTEQLLLYFQYEPVTPYITGAVQLKLSQGRMNSMPFIFAGERVCCGFGKTVGPLFEQIRCNTDEAKTLAATRDLLLPKLMSGEIRVRDSDRVAEAAQ